jgi:hypothetical protein
VVDAIERERPHLPADHHHQPLPVVPDDWALEVERPSTRGLRRRRGVQAAIPKSPGRMALPDPAFLRLFGDRRTHTENN